MNYRLNVPIPGPSLCLLLLRPHQHKQIKDVFIISTFTPSQTQNTQTYNLKKEGKIQKLPTILLNIKTEICKVGEKIYKRVYKTKQKMTYGYNRYTVSTTPRNTHV